MSFRRSKVILHLELFWLVVLMECHLIDPVRLRSFSLSIPNWFYPKPIYCQNLIEAKLSYTHCNLQGKDFVDRILVKVQTCN